MAFTPAPEPTGLQLLLHFGDFVTFGFGFEANSPAPTPHSPSKRKNAAVTRLQAPTSVLPQGDLQQLSYLPRQNKSFCHFFLPCNFLSLIPISGA